MSSHDHKPLRTRTTWKARSAAMNDPPANPGYGEFDKDHPAAYPQPTEADLAKGDPSAWAEDPTPPPYKEGNPPANPGYDEFDKDHPAMYSKTREPMTASARQQRIAADKERIKRLAVRCTKASRAFLGAQASEDEVAQLGSVLMNDPNRLARIEKAPVATAPAAPAPTPAAPAPASAPPAATSQSACDPGVMGDDMMMDDVPADDMAPVDLGSFDDGDDDLDDLNDETLDDGGVFGSDNAMSNKALQEITSTLKNINNRLASVEDRLTPASAKSAASKEAAQRALTASSARSLFAALDSNRDGKVLASEWKGSRLLFAALDRNDDGVISAQDLYKGLGVPAPTAATPALKPQDATLAARVAEESEGEKEEMGEDGGSDDSGKTAGDDDLPPFLKDKDEEDEVNKEAAKAPTASKRPAPSKAASKPPKGKKAAEDEGDKKDDEDQASSVPTASAKAPTAAKAKGKKAAEGDEDDKKDDEATDAQAGSIFAEEGEDMDDEDDDGAEPMASAPFFDDGVAPMSAADQAVIDEVFGGGPAASEQVPLNPQPRRASNGAKALGAAGMARQASTAKPAGLGRGRRVEDLTPDELSSLWG